MIEHKHITQYVSGDIISQLDDILSGKSPMDSDEQLMRFNAAFGDGIEIDLNIVGVRDDQWSKGNSYVDSILFHDGCEADCKIGESLNGVDFEFEYNDSIYILTIKGR